MNSVLISILQDEDLLNVLQSQVGVTETPTLRDRFESSVKTLQNPSFVIPVLGVQGSGKSSLLNAILLQDIVLPVDADETTCIPTEINYGDLEHPQAHVVYKDGRVAKCECSEEGLKSFVHQEFNPSNVKNVSHISIALRHPLLKTGVVLVDLPGVGSITEGNRNTTMKYIKQSAGAIFLLRTVPPITHSESIFIQGAWPLMSHTFFIQNQWSDECLADVEDGRSHNLQILKKIADACRIPADDLHIDVISVAPALTATVRQDQSALTKTRLPLFVNKLNKFADDWQHEAAKEIKNNLLELIKGCQIDINARVDEIGKSNEARINDLDMQKQLFRKEFRAKEALINSCMEVLQKQKDELHKLVLQICRFETENLRNDMRQVINDGVTGGYPLNKAFENHRNEKLDKIFEKIQPQILTLIQEIKERFEALGDFSFKKNDKIFTKDANINGQSTIHAFYTPTATITGASLGTWGGIVAGAKIGALAGTALGPGWGNVIGFVAGAGIGLLGTLLGSKVGHSSQQYHIDAQKEVAREQIFKIVDEFDSQVSKSYKDQLKEFCSSLESSINTWMSNHKKEFAIREEQIISDSAKSEKEKQQLIVELNENIKILETRLKIIIN